MPPGHAGGRDRAGACILKATDPATISLEQANVYELVINLRGARTLGVALPRTLLRQATRVVQ
jgi:ABC-type uncharacterized transport system substrate-binding protein